MTGYQEVVSDPSYAGQVVVMTAPHIGNYGVNAADDQAAAPYCSALITRALARRHSSWRAEETLDAYLRRHGLVALSGVDTRRLTKHLREQGAMPVAVGAGDAAAGLTDGMSMGEVADALTEARVPLRLQVYRGRNGATIMDDTYNASPSSMMAALDLLAELPGRRIVLLGDMRELGMLEEEGHQESALVHYKRALEADPLCAETHVSLALLYEKLGLRRTAREHWRRYLQLDPAGPWCEVAQRHLVVEP